MNLTILIPHFRNGAITAYSVSQLLKYRGKHELDIVVIDNSPGDWSIEFLNPFLKEITIVNYPKDKLQSHGISFDYLLDSIRTEWFITIESDSFPTRQGWLDYYENVVNSGYDSAGSLLHLSGGAYVHPCGALYKKSVWQECKDYCDKIEYAYFPNMAKKEGFDCHLMVHDSIFDAFLKDPEDYVELGDAYKPYTPLKAIEKLEYYKPTVGPFHNGMGAKQESIATYGQRTIESEISSTLVNGRCQKLIKRIGLEPGQFMCYFQYATGKKIFQIPTDVKWLPNRENQQQEYTLMGNGFTHLWAGTAYLDMKDTQMHDVYEFKSAQIEELYNSLPKNQKI